MSLLRIGFDEIRHFAKRGRLMGREYRRRAEIVVRATGLRVQADAQINARQMFRPSSEGGMSTGATANSITMDHYGLKAVVAPGTHYAIFLEYGTRKMQPPRPFMGNAAKRNEEPFVKALEKVAEEVWG